jgi:pimeloyl-ACP methyl ester carboxylesterase/predicted enzyme related to lactoylglutathione lyase
MERLPLALVEFPADEPEPALRFWGGLLGVEMRDRVEGEGEGWQSRGSAPPIGVHARGPGPGDTVSLPYFEVDDLAGALLRVQGLGGSVIHPGEQWAVCKDSEGSPFGLAAGLVSGDREETSGRVVSYGACHPASTMAEPARETPSPRPTPARRGAAKRRQSLEPREQEMVLHGHRMSYRTAGEGPVVLLIHGITGTSEQWNDVFPLLAERYTVVAPDLLGHGRSAKPRGDYSLGAYAVGIRDLLIALGHQRVTVVGHSLGGGIALQFAYEYPAFAERLVVVSSGGLGREVHPLLRAATLPGAELVLPLIAHERVLSAGIFAGRLLKRIGLEAAPDLAEMARGYASLGDGGARQAFLHTLRAVLDPLGQRVSATDRLYLAAMVPTLILWGRRDPLIPCAHAESAHGAMPGSELEVFEKSGHFLHIDQPVRFARALIDFIDSTEPAEFEYSDVDLAEFRERLLAGASGAKATRA